MSTFSHLCETLQRIRETRGTNAKTSVCAEYLQSLDKDEELNIAARLIGEGAFPRTSSKRASVGSRTSGLAAAAFCEIDYDLVFKPCRTATGSNSETIERLMENIPEARKKRRPEPISLQEIQMFFEKLYQAGSRAKKEQVLWSAWKKMTPVEIKFFIRMLGQGSLRIGFESRSVAIAIAIAFGQKQNDVHYAHMITGSLGKTAVLARQNCLDDALFRLFHPLSFMLASPVDNRLVDNFTDYIAEEKFDGMRAQVHVDGYRVAVFSRDLNDVTRSFPDIVNFFQHRSLPPAVLDGEICVFKENTILPFQLLQKRMGLKKPGKKILEAYPVLFVAYDLLFARNEPVFDLSLTQRRIRLEKIAAEYRIPVTNQFQIDDEEELERCFDRAIRHGNEGLMLKRKNSPYEYGQRKKSWLKVKKPGGSLDTVMMYAHAGSGKRGGTYSDFTLGISVKEDDRYEEEFIPIGKAYGGYTDEELKKINSRIRELAVKKYGPTVGLLPELVVEIEFDDIQVNKRTKAGYTLRFPRFKTIRWDLGPGDADTLKTVEHMYQTRLEAPRLTQKEQPSLCFFR